MEKSDVDKLMNQNVYLFDIFENISESIDREILALVFFQFTCNLLADCP